MLGCAARRSYRRRLSSSRHSALGAAGLAAAGLAALLKPAAASDPAASSEDDAAVAASLEGVSQRLRRIESSLDGQRRVLVVGGGIVGASIALQLTRQGCQVCLVEADGASKPTQLSFNAQ